MSGQGHELVEFGSWEEGADFIVGLSLWARIEIADDERGFLEVDELVQEFQDLAAFMLKMSVNRNVSKGMRFVWRGFKLAWKGNFHDVVLHFKANQEYMILAKEWSPQWKCWVDGAAGGAGMVVSWNLGQKFKD